ncbi:MAG: AhpC/TSA family protein [Mediterranea sp.]|jgi:peroxiredoxin|nr:AhpC/TSA family protein [Mediterranea sp.]
MKKNLIYLFLCATLTVCAQTPAGRLSLNGEVKAEGKVYLHKFNNKMYRLIDSTRIVNGTFSFSTEAKLPEIYGLSLTTSQSPYMIFLDNQPTTVKLDTAHYYRHTVVTGSALQDLFVDYQKDRQVKIDAFIKAHPKSLVSVYALYRDFSYRLTPEEIKANLKLLDPSLLKTPYASVLQELVNTLGTVAVGQRAPDFTANDPSGNPVKLSGHLGKGYLLIDFWASWCGPCRRENPNVVRAYRQYKDQGFSVFGVSLDRSEAAWKVAIDKDSLTWTQVSDLRFWNSEPAKLYGVRAIPSNVLVDSNGIIVARNLRGEELDKVLEELHNSPVSKD